MSEEPYMYVEVVIYDPKDPDTYPSVCADPAEVEARFGYTGGEKLIFTWFGSYVGQLTKEVAT
jgi:hypothetical protein